MNRTDVNISLMSGWDKTTWNANFAGKLSTSKALIMSQLNCRPQSCQLFGSCINAFFFFSAGLHNSHRLPLPLCWMRAFLWAASSCKKCALALTRMCVTARAMRQSQAFISGLHTMCDFISTWQPIFRWQRTRLPVCPLETFYRS